jgi:citryl-CoA lyase
MEYKTGISKLQENDVIVRGVKLSELIKKGKFTDTVFLEIFKRAPGRKESEIFEKMLISIIDHGMGTTSSMTSRFIASGGNAINVAVAGGILSMGDYHGGAVEKAMELFYSLKDIRDDQKEKIETNIRNMVKNKKIIYGFGHKHYKNGDPRVKVLLEEIKRIEYESDHLFIKDIVEKTFEEIKRKKIHINIDGVIALLLCDFSSNSKIEPVLGKGIFIIGRTPGLVAQAFEELKNEKPVRRIPEEEIKYEKDVSNHKGQ